MEQQIRTSAPKYREAIMSPANTDIGAEYQQKELKQRISAQFGVTKELFTTTCHEIEQKIFLIGLANFSTTWEKRRMRE